MLCNISCNFFLFIINNDHGSQGKLQRENDGFQRKKLTISILHVILYKNMNVIFALSVEEPLALI